MTLAGRTADEGRAPPRRPSARSPRLVAFATDLDRTLMRPGGRPSPVARRALREARALGLRTLLVSGRRYPELLGFVRSLGALDGLVAENGAVVEAPLGTAPTVAGRRCGAAVRRRLRDRPDLPCEIGEVVVSVDRSDLGRLRRAVAGLPVRLLANVDRVMVLPRRVTKRTGVRRALRQLDLANGAYAAIGDAENDLDLLLGARLTGAVANAEPVVRQAAEYVCRDRYEDGVLEFVRGPIAQRARAVGSTDR